MAEEKVLSLDALKERLDGLKASGKRIVFTNGCFDIIHVGHVRYLQEARSLGDVLVIGLNSDSSVSRIKSGADAAPKRPVVDQADRAEVLAALEPVSYVCIFDEDTPYGLISTLLPDVLVKGGDWKPEEIVGSDIVKDTRSLPFHAERSTTGIIEKILGTAK